MKIKRYTASSMRGALALVRAEQGADAVILSSRRGPDGIEVIAAVDYDEGLFQDMNRQRLAAIEAARESAAAAQRPASAPPVSSPRTVAAPAPDRSAAPKPAPRPAPDMARSVTPVPKVAVAVPRPMTAAPAAPRPAPIAAPRPAAPAPRFASAASRPAAPGPAAPSRAAAWGPAAIPQAAAARANLAPVPGAVRASSSADPALGAMQRQLKDMQRMLETGLADMSWNDRRLREPLKARVLEDLAQLDIAPDVAMALASLAPKRTTVDDPSRIPLALLVKHLPVTADLSSLSSGVVAVVGPTGAGKTTTIAKLAARWCMEHGSADLALVSTDGYRIGARDQLMTYARILDAPMHAASGARDLRRILERLSSKKLILIDTAGMGPRDARLTEQLEALKLGARGARVLLALPAQGEGRALDEIVRAFAGAAPAGCILTKVDEAASMGAVISATLRHRLPIAYVCDGQRVPDDLHAAHERRIWLARWALKLKERRPPNPDPAQLSRHFGRVPAHA
ncbi:MAG TPA: flagellar biosynthesis protein FlhF [Steroidobacteraceae bacterium]|jgi:flagellar biosynthesis protein FlhF|nr:flagellar biosynthesis protein FlhF [Steroidobacteraceae bacterium]